MTILVNCGCWLFFCSRAQSYAVQLPGDFVCEDCTIRLLREGLEWGNSYRFWSCADVDIKNSNYCPLITYKIVTACPCAI